ncbi:hypothetical protein EV127DRAFT_500602 [Xylaria flabelliformis]|nr:hypothetical protein EV127DRAFT_500602 [Xylaria flabelliformis]
MDKSTSAIPSLPTTPYLAVIVLFIVLATAAVGLRIYKRKKYSGIAIDNYLIICSLIPCWGLFVTAIVAAAGGGIDHVKGDPLEAAVLFLKLFITEPVIGFPAFIFVRLSVIFFYKRIFTRIWFEKVCIVFSVIVVCWGLAGVVVELTSAYPLSNIWDPFNPNSYRINFDAYAISLNASGIALDVITLTLPLGILLVHKTAIQLRPVSDRYTAVWLPILFGSTIQCKKQTPSHTTGSDRYSIPRNVWLWDRITLYTSVVTACLPTYAPLVKGRNIMEFLIRMAGAWFSFGTQGSLGSKVSNRFSVQRTTGGYVRSDSNEQVDDWHRTVEDHAVHTTHVTAEDIELHHQAHFRSV